MTKQSIVLMTNEEGLCWFDVEIEDISDYHVDFMVYEVLSWEYPEGTPLDKDLYMKAGMRWDGNSYIALNPSAGGLTLYNKEDFKVLSEVIMKVYDLATSLIKNYDEVV